MTPLRSKRRPTVPFALLAVLLAGWALCAFAREAPLLNQERAIGPTSAAHVEAGLAATDPADPLVRANGRVVDAAAGLAVGDPAGVDLEAGPPTWPDRLLRALGDPNVAYILLLLGFYGLVYELANPGTVLPGTLGAICLVLALYVFQMLPINWAGLALIGLGLGLMIAEAFTPSFGALGLGGIAAFVGASRGSRGRASSC